MIELRENNLDVETYLYLRETVNWKKLSKEQAEKALNNSIYTICIYRDGKAVGMGRLVGDGAVICYVQDLIIHPDAQRSGLGSIILEKIIDKTKKIGIAETTIMLDLMCAKGREKFYQKHGFILRPTNMLGPGMIQYLQVKDN